MAYLLSRFPLLSETFILRELERLRLDGWEVTLIPLLRAGGPVRHPEAERWVGQAWYTPFVSPAILGANLRALRRDPVRYLGLWGEVLRGTWRCPNFLLGAVGIFPKSVYLAERLRRAGIRHVHAHYLTHPALAAFIISRLAGVSYSLTAHAHDLYVRQDFLAEKVRGARFVAAISEFNRRFIARVAGPDVLDRISVVHCGVEPEAYRPAEPPAGGPLRIVAVASLQPYKGLTHLVQACALLKARGVELECRVVGDGELREALQSEIAAAGLERDVHLVGPLPQREVARELGRATVVVAPSVVTPSGKMEGIPVALMEALASERPVVATRISGVPELVRHEETGLLVEPGDPDGLAGALERLRADPALGARLARRGRELVEREFDLATNVRALEQLFRRALRDGLDQGDRS